MSESLSAVRCMRRSLKCLYAVMSSWGRVARGGLRKVNRSCCEINLAGNNMSEGLKDLHDAMQENTSVKLTF